MDKAKWKDVWLSNYSGQSDASKELDSMMKKNYKGHNYIPWATMVKWLYLMDENATLEVVKTATKDGDESYVHTATGQLEFTDSEVKGDVEKQKITRTTHKANFVVIKCNFMGRDFEEVYPIQDNSYNAPNYYDSNMVNKSIQRAKVKVISIATGLAFSLYETGDLQFEDDNKADNTDKKTIKVVKQELPKKTIIKTEEVVEAEVVEAEVVEAETCDYSPDVMSIYNLVKTREDVLPILQTLNKDIVKTYGFSLSPKDSKDELLAKINSLSNPTIFNKMLEKRLADGKRDN